MKIFILSIFEWPFCTGFTVLVNLFSIHVSISRKLFSLENTLMLPNCFSQYYEKIVLSMDSFQYTIFENLRSKVCLKTWNSADYKSFSIFLLGNIISWLNGRKMVFLKFAFISVSFYNILRYHVKQFFLLIQYTVKMLAYSKHHDILFGENYFCSVVK